MALSRDIGEAARAIHALQQQIRQFSEIQSHFTSAVLGTSKLEALGEAIRRQMHEVNRVSEVFAKQVTEIGRPASDVSRMISKMLESSQLALQIDKISRAARDWQSLLKATALPDQSRWLAVETHFAKLYEISALAELNLHTVNLARFGEGLRLDEPTRATLTEYHNAFGTEYRLFFDRLTADESAIIKVPPALSELPAVEYLNQSALVASTSGTTSDDDSQTVAAKAQVAHREKAPDQLIHLLAGLDSELPTLLLGARAAVRSGHEDYVRHLAASLRELFTHVLHKLAPDDQVRAWSTIKEDYHDGRPTRRARLRYIIRDVQSTFGGFINADVDAVVGFINSFQKGTHALRADFTSEQVRDLSVRMEGLLLLLLVIHNYKVE
jgi:hypothetical protein